MEAAVYATLGLLFVGLLSGLAFLAVYFPRTFRSTVRPLLVVALLLCTVGLGFLLGLLYSGSVVEPFIAADKVKQAKAALEIGLPTFALVGTAVIFAVTTQTLLSVAESIHREKKEIETARKRGK